MFQKHYRTMSKQKIIGQYLRDYQDFWDNFFQIPKDNYNNQISGCWNVKEFLSHMAGWDQETIMAIKEVMKGKIPWFFDHQDEVDAFNIEQIDKRKNIKLPDIITEIDTNHQELINFLQKLPENLFHKEFGKVWHEQEVTPALVCSYRHFATHKEDIVLSLKKMRHNIHKFESRRPPLIRLKIDAMSDVAINSYIH